MTKGIVCCGCGSALVRRLTRRELRSGLARAAYCQRCIRAKDQVPVDFDHGRSRDSGTGTLERRGRSLARRMEEGAVLHSRAQDLLWSGELKGEGLAVWELFVIDGLSERQIAKRLRMHWTTVRNRYLGPYGQRCGYPIAFKALLRKPRERPRRLPSGTTADPISGAMGCTTPPAQVP